MTSTIVVIAILVIGLVVWLTARHLRGTPQQERSRILKRLQEIEEERQKLIDDSADQGNTISTERVLKHVEALKAKYLESGQEEAARSVERVISEFREQNGPEIPIDKAYALMQALEGKDRE